MRVKKLKLLLIVVLNQIIFAYDFWYERLGVGVDVKLGKSTLVVWEASEVLGKEALDIYYNQFGAYSTKNIVYVDEISRSVFLTLASFNHRFYFLIGYEETPLEFKDFNGSNVGGWLSLGFESKSYLFGSKFSLFSKTGDFGKIDFFLGLNWLLTEYLRLYYLYYNAYNNYSVGVVNIENNSGLSFITDLTYKLPFLPVSVSIDFEIGSKAIERRPAEHIRIENDVTKIYIINRRKSTLDEDKGDVWSTGFYYGFSFSVKVFLPFGE